MKLMTWNVNGIKTLLQYHPWSEKKTYENILDTLETDILCIQETKITRDKVDELMCCMPSYDSFFSFYRRNPPKGYSGTAIFTKKSTCVPVKAEEGLTGLLKKESSLSSSSSTPTSSSSSDATIGYYPTGETQDLTISELKDLDSEGRATVVDLGYFVLINLYMPNETNETRLDFKMKYNHLLESRIKNLINVGKREVIVVGDMNVSPKKIDHCDPDRRAKDHGLGEFEEHPARKWFNEMIGENGILIDVCRKLHPNREGMFTCWDTKINARASNYGTRLDYILITPNLLPWVKTCNIHPEIKGSDHCPVSIEFHDSIIINNDDDDDHHHHHDHHHQNEDSNNSKKKLKLWKLINPDGRKSGEEISPPSFAGRYYREFLRREKDLSSFFVKKNSSSVGTSTREKTTITDRTSSSSSSSSQLEANTIKDVTPEVTTTTTAATTTTPTTDAPKQPSASILPKPSLSDGSSVSHNGSSQVDSLFDLDLDPEREQLQVPISGTVDPNLTSVVEKLVVVSKDPPTPPRSEVGLVASTTTTSKSKSGRSSTVMKEDEDDNGGEEEEEEEKKSAWKNQTSTSKSKSKSKPKEVSSSSSSKAKAKAKENPNPNPNLKPKLKPKNGQQQSLTSFFVSPSNSNSNSNPNPNSNSSSSSTSKGKGKGKGKEKEKEKEKKSDSKKSKSRKRSASEAELDQDGDGDADDGDDDENGDDDNDGLKFSSQPSTSNSSLSQKKKFSGSDSLDDLSQGGGPARREMGNDDEDEDDNDMRMAMKMSMEVDDNDNDNDNNSANSIPSTHPHPHPHQQQQQKPQTQENTQDTKAAWSAIMFNRAPTPVCTKHGEMAKEFTCNKTGVNKGRKFWVCSRPVGPGYERDFKKRSEGEFNPEYKCNFFKWKGPNVKRPLSSLSSSLSTTTTTTTMTMTTTTTSPTTSSTSTNTSSSTIINNVTNDDPSPPPPPPPPYKKRKSNPSPSSSSSSSLSSSSLSLTLPHGQGQTI